VLIHDAFLPLTLGLGLLLGLWGICWARLSPRARLARWGQCLFILTFLALGAATFAAALYRLDGLAPLGLLSGLLVVGMVWDGPRPAARSLPVSDDFAELLQSPALPRLTPDGSRVA
jgi:hypothetical protein